MVLEENTFVAEYVRRLQTKPLVRSLDHGRDIPQTKSKYVELSSVESLETGGPSDGSGAKAGSTSATVEISVTFLRKGKVTGNFKLSHLPTDFVLSVKQRVGKLTGFTADSIRLLLKGKALQNDKRLVDYNVESGAVLHASELPGAVAAPVPGDIRPEIGLSKNVDEGFWASLLEFASGRLGAEDGSKLVAHFKKASTIQDK